MYFMCVVSVLQVQTEAPRAAVADGGSVFACRPHSAVQMGAPRRRSHGGNLYLRHLTPLLWLRFLVLCSLPARIDRLIALLLDNAFRCKTNNTETPYTSSLRRRV